MKQNKYNVTAIIYDKKGNILSIGKNSYRKTHPMQAKFARKVGRPDRVFLHAEIDAIVRCRNIDDAYRIFVTRTDKMGHTRLAKPCPICAEALQTVGIKHVEHT